MISAAAAMVLGPPTCGATARSTPRMSSGVTPSASALPICHAYEAGARRVRSSRDLDQREGPRVQAAELEVDSRRPIAWSRRSASPAEIPDRV